MKTFQQKVMMLVVVGIAVFGFASASWAKSIVKVDGSSTVYPITEAVAEEFQKEQKGAVHVTVGISGTGGGFKKFCRGEIDIADASRPILKKEMDDCYLQGITYIELPIAYDALTVIVNPKNTWATTLTVAELKKIWAPESQKQVMKWNQVRPSFPDRPLTLYGAGADSGTFDYFTEAIVGKSKSSRGDYTASEDDNVLVQGIANDPNALGYFGFAYYEENRTRLKAVGVDGGKGGVLPSRATVENGTYQPLARPIFIYINAASLGRPEVKGFVDFYLKHAAQLTALVKYIPLPAADYAAATTRLEKRQIGTAFAGKSEVGLKVEEILRRTPKP